jgi:porin
MGVLPHALVSLRVKYALGNLFTDNESFDPPSTPAMEVRVMPTRYLYVKLMVMAGVRSPFSQNPTGLVPHPRP